MVAEFKLKAVRETEAGSRFVFRSARLNASSLQSVSPPENPLLISGLGAGEHFLLRR